MRKRNVFVSLVGVFNNAANYVFVDCYPDTSHGIVEEIIGFGDEDGVFSLLNTLQSKDFVRGSLNVPSFQTGIGRLDRFCVMGFRYKAKRRSYNS